VFNRSLTVTKKVVGVFVRFRAPLHTVAKACPDRKVLDVRFQALFKDIMVL
jgi:hypothetical protein